MRPQIKKLSWVKVTRNYFIFRTFLNQVLPSYDCRRYIRFCNWICNWTTGQGNTFWSIIQWKNSNEDSTRGLPITGGCQSIGIYCGPLKQTNKNLFHPIFTPPFILPQTRSKNVALLTILYIGRYFFWKGTAPKIFYSKKKKNIVLLDFFFLSFIHSFVVVNFQEGIKFGHYMLLLAM